MAFASNLTSLHFVEFQTLRLDGELTPFCSVLDSPDDASARAQRVLGRHRDTLVLSSWSAAWAFGCCAEPRIHIASFRHGRSHIPTTDRLIVVHRTFHEDDLVNDTTTPLRTVADLLKEKGRNEHVLHTAYNLMRLNSLSTHDVLRHVDRSKTAPYRALITSRLTQLVERYPSETR